MRDIISCELRDNNRGAPISGTIAQVNHKICDPDKGGGNKRQELNSISNDNDIWLETM